MLSINTNTTALMVQKNLSKATKGLNAAIEKLTTGSKLNHAKDNPANYAIAQDIKGKLSSWSIAEENIMMGNDLLETASSNADLISNHVIRIRDLCEQACNGTYGEASIKAMKAEISARLDEIDRIRESTEYNDIKLFGEIDNEGNVSGKNINIQVGITLSDSSRISVDTSLDLSLLNDLRNADITDASTLDLIDSALNKINDYQVNIGASQNRLSYALDYVDVTTRNLTSSLMTINDADIAEVSSEFIKYQILQQACITLLSTANQMPALALQLL